MEVPLLAGQPDDFIPPPEPTDQSPDYADFLQNVWIYQGDRIFDETGIDAALGHSFAGWMGAVCGATLELKVRAFSGSCDNDSFRLGLTGIDTPADGFVYWRTFRSLRDSGTWPPGAEETFTFDLSDLPPSSSFPTNVLPELQDGELELMVEDDTMVDYALLRVCLCAVEVEDEGWGRVKAGYR
jgi:hypothetical protein